MRLTVPTAPRLLTLVRLVPVAGLAALAACGDSGTSPSTLTTVSFAGSFASAAKSGVIKFSTQAAAALPGPAGVALASAPIQYTGELDFSDGSAKVVLSGTVNGAALSLSGGGYTFTGNQSGDLAAGDFTGPNGQSGTFSAVRTTTSAAVKVLCGEYTGDDSGVFSLALKPDRTGGVILVPSTGGGFSGKARPKSGTTDQVEVLPDAQPNFVIATGTLTSNGDNISGSWNDGQGSSGTFVGNVASCTPS